MDPDTSTRDDEIMTWIPLVRRIASSEYRRLGSLTKLLVIDVDDLFQSGVLGLIRAIDHFNRELSAPQTYYTRRIRGAIYDFLRSFPYIQWNGSRVERADASELESRPAPCAEFARVEVRIDFERLVRRLSPQQRDVIWGMAQEMPQNVIARGLGVTAGRVSQIKNESFIALRSAFGYEEQMPVDEEADAPDRPDTWYSDDVLIGNASWNALESNPVYEASMR